MEFDLMAEASSAEESMDLWYVFSNEFNPKNWSQEIGRFFYFFFLPMYIFARLKSQMADSQMPLIKNSQEGY